MPHIMDAYERDSGFFRSALHVPTDKAFCKGEYPVRRLYSVYFVGIVLYLLHDGTWHGDCTNAVASLGRRDNIAACLVLQGFGDLYGIFFKVQVCQCEGEEFPKPHTRVEKQFQGCTCAYIGYMLDELVVLLYRPKVHGACALSHVPGFCAWIGRKIIISDCIV